MKRIAHWDLCFTVLAVALATRTASAHVELDDHTGGEILQAGTVSTITWHIVISHNLQNWDLWYSTDGGMNWTPIATDLPPGSAMVGSIHTYDWTVPDTPSDEVRVRVRMDNSGTDYYDESGANLAIVPAGSTTHVVNQVGFTFVPADITVQPLDVVEWHWSAGIHTVTSGTPCTPDGQFFNSPLDSGNQLFPFVIPDDGTTFIPYFCIPHCGIGMTGTITISEPTGACCDGKTGICQDDVLEADCMANQDTWFDGLPCSDPSIVCEPHRGACCDGFTGICVDDVLEADCLGEQDTWTAKTLCVNLVPPCERHTGACCDGISGLCTDDVLPENCAGDKQEWFKGQQCQDIACITIPAVSEWGLAVMGLLLVTAGAVLLVRRRRVTTS